MVIKVRDKHGCSAPIEIAVPAGADVDILLYPGDIPTIEPHNDRKNSHNVRSFDATVGQDGELMLDWVNVTKVANNPPNEPGSEKT